LKLLLVLSLLPSNAWAGFNVSAPKPVRRIFTQIAFAEGRLVSYHVLEPGPLSIQAFPTSHETGVLMRFPGCPDLRPVLDDSAVPSPDSDHLIPDHAMREVLDAELSRCGSQPTSLEEAMRMSIGVSSIGFVNAPNVPAPVGAPVAIAEQQSADELWGPLPNVGVVDLFAGGNLSPQHIEATTESGLPVSNVQQPDLRRPRISAYAGGRLIYFITYETKGLAGAGLVRDEVEEQWRNSAFPGERDLFFNAYGRAPLPPNGFLPPQSLDSNGRPNDMQGVLNVVGGAPFWYESNYSPLWKMHCLDGGVTPNIGPGLHCGSVRYYQIGQPRYVSEERATGLPIVPGIVRDVNCPIIATDVNDDGVFADAPGAQERVAFPDVDWNGDGNTDDGVHDSNSTLK
jgi:hypothetical protein